MLKDDDIWNTAEEVWRSLPSSKIASAYIQTFRISQKVVKAGGDNAFLGSSGSIHVGVRDGFHETSTGLRRKDGKVFVSTP